MTAEHTCILPSTPGYYSCVVASGFQLNSRRGSHNAQPAEDGRIHVCSAVSHFYNFVA